MKNKFNPVFSLLCLILSLWFSSNSRAQDIPFSPQEISNIQQKINSVVAYPDIAKLNGWGGIAKVKIILSEDGRIKDIDIAESSGYPLLDATAMMAIKDASPYPLPKDYAYNQDLEIILPVQYLAGQRELSLMPETPQFPSGQVFPDIASDGTAGAISPPGELESFLDLSLKNNQPIQVAHDEIQFAQLKITEAQRNLLPAVKLSGYSAGGEYYDIDYAEKEAKVEMSQPLFYGGRLVDSLKQAKVNLEISQKNYDRLKLEALYKTEGNYYYVLANRMNLAQKEEFYRQGKELLETIKKLADQKMIIPSELSSAQNWMNQINFQVEAAKQDLTLAELTFKQVLNAKENPEIKGNALQVKPLDLTLEKCLELAFKNRPEIFLGQLLVKFTDYGRRIESEKLNAFNVDFNSYYSNYAGHYKVVPWQEHNNWYMGVKVTKALGASTMGSSYTYENTLPRIAQSSTTITRTASGEFNLLDNLARVTDKKKSDIEFKRALSDFNEAFKNVNFEVREAFANYQKALLQLNTAQREKQLRADEFAIIKVRALVGEISLSSAMETLFNLSEAQTKYTQALAQYQFSLTGLKKATGYSLKI